MGKDWLLGEMPTLVAANLGSGKEKEKKHMPMFHLEPVDLLVDHKLLDIRFQKFEPASQVVNVVFVDEKGEPNSLETKRVIKAAGLPTIVRLPNEKNGAAFLYGNRSALLVVSVKKKDDGLTLQDIRKMGGLVTRTLAKEQFLSANVYLHYKIARRIKSQDALSAFLHGLQTPTYTFDDLKQKKDEPMALKYVAVLDHNVAKSKAESVRDFVNDLVRAEHNSRRWIDMPAQVNCFSTPDVVRLVREIEKQHGTLVDSKIIMGEELNRQGLNALWSVGKGRMPEAPPALIVMRYMGAGKKAPTIAFVGKCLVFDTGGEQIKPGDGMLGMKADMGGASAVLAAFLLLVRRRAKVNVIATLAVADNAVSHMSYHPGDVLRTYGGRTVEVDHTDAEGRLALADAVAYTEINYKPDYLFTLATLTGAAVVALGQEFAALFGKTDRIVEALKAASVKTWNKAWHMPLNEAEHTDVKPSQIADTTNLGARPGGSISAAKFVTSFAEMENMGHLDVAPVLMEGYDATGVQQKFSGGWGPAILWELAHDLSEK